MQTMCNVSRSSEVMEHGIFTSVPERAIVASRKLSLARGVGNWKDLFPCMRGCSSRAFSINMFLTDFTKAALEKQFYLFYDPEALRDLDVSASQSICTDSERRRAGSQGTTPAWQKPTAELRWVGFCRCLHTWRPQSRHSAQSITCTCALSVIPCSTGHQEK